ncbi:MAG: signal recognition particle-docking protein FtsY, partial [Candidatus Woesearchaeota archaeon]
MFKFLKDKIKNAVSKISKEAEEKTEVIEEPESKEEIIEEKPKEKKKGFFGKVFGKKELIEDEKKLDQIQKELKKEIDYKEKEEDIEIPEEKEVEEQPKKEEVIEEKVEEKTEEIEIPEEKEIVEDIKEKIIDERPKEEQIVEDVKEEVLDEDEKDLKEIKKDLEEDKEKLEHIFPKEKKSFFGKIKESITKKSLTEKEFENLFYELEFALLENNVAMEVIEKIKDDLKKELVETKVLRGKVKDIIEKTLKQSLNEILGEDIDILNKIKSKKPYVILFVGINGTGKTTSVAKLANYLKEKKLSCVLAAADTFRAAAIQQLEEHANNLNLKIIKHDYGSDPAAVAFDAIKYAESKNLDVVLIDTAGRQHSNSNLMDELKKVNRVANPDLKVFVGDSLTGNDCVDQSTQFNEAIGIDAVILTKVDVDEKGGAAISVSYITKKPIIFIGVGQRYEDFKLFEKKLVLENLG